MMFFDPRKYRRSSGKMVMAMAANSMPIFDRSKPFPVKYRISHKGKVFSLSLEIRIKGMKNSFHIQTALKGRRAAKAGFIIGTNILRNILNSLAPSIQAASLKASGIPWVKLVKK